MRSLILADKDKIGATDAGHRWAMKALHPADAQTSFVRMPTGSPAPTALFSQERIFKFSAPADAVNSWEIGGTLMGHAICPLNLYHRGTSTTWLQPSVLWNGAEDGEERATMVAQNAYLLRNVERYRPVAASVTVLLDAPALADQGTVVASAVDRSPQELPLSVNGETFVYGNVNTLAWQSNDIPSFSTLVQVPGSYTARARDGLYMPLRITNTEFAEVGQQTCINIYSGMTNQLVTKVPVAPEQSVTGSWPFPAAIAFPCAQADVPTYFPPFSQWNMSSFVFTNLSLQASLTIRLRVAYEVCVNTASTLYPFVSIAPPRDDDALFKYREIVQRLSMGYPASYNDLGLLGRKIKDILGKIVTKGIPALGGLVKTMYPVTSPIVDGAIRLVNAPAERRARKQPRPTARGLALDGINDFTPLAKRRDAVRRAAAELGAPATISRNAGSSKTWLIKRGVSVPFRV